MIEQLLTAHWGTYILMCTQRRKKRGGVGVSNTIRTKAEAFSQACFAVCQHNADNNELSLLQNIYFRYVTQQYSWNLIKIFNLYSYVGSFPSLKRAAYLLLRCKFLGNLNQNAQENFNLVNKSDKRQIMFCMFHFIDNQYT